MSLQVASEQLRGHPETAILSLAGVHDPHMNFSSFTPRPVESDPGALKVPFFHNNDDYDEVLFYHRGNFFSRDNIEQGMVTFHPCGFPHGPHPKALKKAL